jgi:hypothetical protein
MLDAIKATKQAIGIGGEMETLMVQYPFEAITADNAYR